MNRITLVTDAWQPQINGVVRTLEETILQLNRKGFLVKVVEPSMFKTFPCPTYPEIPLSWNIWKAGKMIEDTRPHYLHIFTEGPLGLAAKLWADRRQIPYTTSYHTKYPEYLVDYFGGGLVIGYKAIKWFHGKARAVMVNTNSMADRLALHKMKNTVVWSRGVDLDLFTPNGKTPEFFQTLPRPILINVGRVAVEKNLPDFYALAGTKIQVGGGPMLNEYREKYPDVHFIGPKQGAELAAYYRGADVFVFPSKSDTFGLVLLESIASGVPVAAYPVEGPIDVVIDPKVGSLNDDLSVAVTQALDLTDKAYLRGWANSRTWSACTDVFISHLVLIQSSRKGSWGHSK